MRKYPSSGFGDLSAGNENVLEDDGADISWPRSGSPLFPGEQYFNEIMFEKMRPQKVAKFRVSKKLASDL